MKRSAYPLTREEPTLGDTRELDVVADVTVKRPRAERPQPTRMRRFLRSFSRLLLVMAVIIGLSYLPESWVQQHHPHFQDAVHICRDIRGLLYRISQDMWLWWQAEWPQWYQSLRALLPEGVRVYLPEW